MEELDRISIPTSDFVDQVFERISKTGKEAYLVGGVVRDYFLNRRNVDWDMTTQLRPDEILELFSDYNRIPVGQAFGIVILEKDGETIEIASYRREDDYRDGRRPEIVEYTDSILEDLQRRDFTVNTLLYNPDQGVVDHLGAIDDLESRVIRAVGNPEKRLSEDYLRIMRAVRFSGVLDFELEPSLRVAIVVLAPLLKQVSAERIREELDKMLLSDKPSRSFDLMADLGLLRIILPELDQGVGYDQQSTFHDFDLYEHTMRVVDQTPPKLELRLAALFHDLGKPDSFFMDDDGEARYYGHQNISKDMTFKIMKRLRYSKALINNVTMLVARHMDSVNWYTEKSVKKLIRCMGEDVFPLFDLQEADVLGTNKPENLDNIENGRELAKRILQRNAPVSARDLAINGRDLKEIGYKEGKKLGNVLEYLTDLVIEDESLNNREVLLNIAKDKL